MSTDRLPWFRCYPGKLLGALGAMKPDEGYLYTVVLLRIYEVGGPIDDDEDMLARRTGMSKRKIIASLDRLIEKAKLFRTDEGLITWGHCDERR
jgi:hypothetical protein